MPAKRHDVHSEFVVHMTEKYKEDEKKNSNLAALLTRMLEDYFVWL
jgi:hypothetical protein